MKHVALSFVVLGLVVLAGVAGAETTIDDYRVPEVDPAEGPGDSQSEPQQPDDSQTSGEEPQQTEAQNSRTDSSREGTGLEGDEGGGGSRLSDMKAPGDPCVAGDVCPEGTECKAPEGSGLGYCPADAQDCICRR